MKNAIVSTYHANLLCNVLVCVCVFVSVCVREKVCVCACVLEKESYKGPCILLLDCLLSEKSLFV